MSQRDKAFTEPRPKQPLPATLVADLLHAIRAGFYGDLDEKKWHQEKRFLLRVVTYPAKWLNDRGVTLPPDRYKTVLLDLINEVKRHGDTAAVRHWPGYLLRCVQAHFRMHGEDYYEEGKSIRARTAAALVRSHQAPAADPIESLAHAHSVLVMRNRRKAKAAPTQQSLF